MSLLGVTSNGGVTPHTTSQNYTSCAKNASTCKKTAKIRSKEEGGWVCKCCQGQTPQNFERVLAATCLYRDMLSCQTHLSESAMMAQHSDVGRRRRLQKPYQSLRACAYPWKLQDYTLDHLCRGSSAHRWWFAPSTGAASPTRMLGTHATLEPSQPRQPG
eukprot:COSAG05_NODE_935_length_6533_cov_123.704694_1_plen_160_part_00